MSVKLIEISTNMVIISFNFPLFIFFILKISEIYYLPKAHLSCNKLMRRHRHENFNWIHLFEFQVFSTQDAELTINLNINKLAQSKNLEQLIKRWE